MKNSSEINIDKINVTAYKVPTDQLESDGTLEWDSTTIIITEISAGGKIGLGYTYSHESTADLIKDKLYRIIHESNAMDITQNWNNMYKAIRNIGRPGIVSSAIAAVDIALWDLKAKILELPLVVLMGKVHDSTPIYGSGGFTSYSIKKLQEQLCGWAEKNIKRVKMKIGREPSEDINRVKSVRQTIGKDIELMVDANGAYDRKQALYFADQFKILM